MNDKLFSLEDRILCSDGACIGLVGSDGRCKVCGERYEGGEPLVNESTPENVEQPDLPDDVGPMNNEIQALKKELEEQDSQENELDRMCCSDDTCIGIIGKDGKCGTCGKQS
jgi:hypothetical protein